MSIIYYPLGRWNDYLALGASRFRYYIESHGDGFEIAWKVLENEKLLAEIKTFLSGLATYAAMATGGRVRARIL